MNASVEGRDGLLKKCTPVQKMLLSRMPKTTHRLFLEVWHGNKSPSRAINAFCLECTDYIRQEVAECEAINCPLHRYRPYKAVDNNNNNADNTGETDEEIKEDQIS